MIIDTLNDVLDSIWQRWTRGKADRRSPLHTPVVGSVDCYGATQQRIMVLRGVDRLSRTMRFHTDRRSSKALQIGDGAPLSVLGYDATAKIQMRISGTAHIETVGPTADTAWASSTPSSRRIYLVTPGPGTAVEAPRSGLPKDMEHRVPSLEESESGRGNFAVLVVTIHHIEWLYLASEGHQRAAFSCGGEGIWSGKWLIP